MLSKTESDLCVSMHVWLKDYLVFVFSKYGGSKYCETAVVPSKNLCDSITQNNVITYNGTRLHLQLDMHFYGHNIEKKKPK